MRRIHPKIREPLLIAIVAGGVGIASAAIAQCPRYDVQIAYGPDCGIFGYAPTIPLALNELGHVSGYYVNCGGGYDRAFVWTGGPSITPLSLGSGVTSSRAYGLNSKGQSVGVKEDTAHSGFLYDAGVVTTLPMVPGGNFSEAYAINDKSQICGISYDAVNGQPPLKGVLWQQGTVMVIDLPLGPNSTARDINELGQAVGWMGVAPFPPFLGHAFVWSAGRSVDLGVPPGGLTSDARAINNQGDVCGVYTVPVSGLPSYVRRGVLWSSGTVTDLGLLEDFTQSFALDINDSRQIVGYLAHTSGGGNKAFLWQNGEMRLLNDLVPARSGLNLNYCSAINNAGQIAAQGQLDGPSVLVLLTPIPPIPGDATCDDAVNIDDILGVINHWGTIGGNTPADMNHDGVVNLADLMIVIENWD